MDIDIKIRKRSGKYRIKEVINSEGYSIFYIERKCLGIWWSTTYFYNFKHAKDWIIRRLTGKNTIYHYYPFEDNNN